jgi:hypothetical protein
MQKTFTKMAISSPFTDTRGPPSALETHLTTGQWMPHHDNNPSKRLIVRQEAHAGDMSFLVSFLDSLARGALPATDSHYRPNAYPSVCYHGRTEANRGPQANRGTHD